MSITPATPADVTEIGWLHRRAAEALTLQFGPGRWAVPISEAAVLRALDQSTVVVARHAGRVVGTFRLAQKKPWAIDVSYFTPVQRAVYLLDMAVDPDHQRRGVGRALLSEAARLAAAWPAQSIRLDAFDAPAGAGGFYARCGYRHVGNNVYRGNPLAYYELLV